MRQTRRVGERSCGRAGEPASRRASKRTDLQTRTGRPSSRAAERPSRPGAAERRAQRASGLSGLATGSDRLTGRPPAAAQPSGVAAGPAAQARGERPSGPSRPTGRPVGRQRPAFRVFRRRDARRRPRQRSYWLRELETLSGLSLTNLSLTESYLIGLTLATSSATTPRQRWNNWNGAKPQPMWGLRP